MSDDLLAVLLALAASVSWGFSAVLVRLGLRDLSTALGTHISLAFGLLLTATLVAIFERDAALALSAKEIGLFAIIGVLNFVTGRFFNYMAMSRLGVGRSTPLLASSPLFALLLAVVFTDESVSLGTLAGTFLILGGLFITLTAPRPQRATHAGN